MDGTGPQISKGYRAEADRTCQAASLQSSVSSKVRATPPEVAPIGGNRLALSCFKRPNVLPLTRRAAKTSQQRDAQRRAKRAAEAAGQRTAARRVQRLSWAAGQLPFRVSFRTRLKPKRSISANGD